MELRSAPTQKFEFNRAILSDTLRFLAEECGLNYIALPEDAPTASHLVTFNIEASPFAALETIAEAHGIALVYEDGVWFMRPVNDSQLIGRTYQITFNPGEVVSAGGRNFGGSSTASALSGVAGGGAGSIGASSGGSNSLAVGDFYAPDLTLNNLGANFRVSADEMLSNIEKILGIQTTGYDANIAPQTAVGEAGNIQIDVSSTNLGAPGTNPSSAQPQVIWNSDTNTLFVIATRQQHQFVAAYLESIDRPQPLIAVEVKFFETGRDPRKDFGIDWSGTLADYNVSLDDLETNVDLNDLAATVWPQSAVLSADSINASLRAIVSDSDTKTVSYPRVLTRNNREVTIQSVVNEPVLSAEASTSVAVGGVQTVQVTYLPIGTTINVLPKLMPDGEINMQVAVTVSSIIGNVVINGNPYPKASSRVYTAPLKLRSGYTAAIAGLDEAEDSETTSGIPFLHKLPLLGKSVFGQKSKSRTRKNLMIWITPYVLNGHTEGVAKQPVSEIPITERDPLRHAPQIYANGEPVGGVGALQDLVLWADREQRRIEQLVHERRIDEIMSEDVSDLLRVCDSVARWIEQAKPRYPSKSTELNVQQWSLQEIRRKALREDWQAFVKSDFY